MRRFRVKTAFRTFQVGMIIEPTGIYRDDLIRSGWVEEIFDEPVEAAHAATDVEVPAPKVVEAPKKHKKHA